LTTRTTTAALLATAVLGVGACGDSKDSASSPHQAAATTPVTTTTPATTATTPPAGDTIQQLVISKDLTTKPTIAKPAGAPPTKLYMRDIVTGKGRKAKPGDGVTVQYVGVSYDTGQQFDASWDTGQPFQFQLGAQMVIAGWDQGVVGMRKGGRRMLVIPPDLAYGSTGQGPIAPNATLIFVIDLKKLA
jgi:peptidylprolyl isomerase